MRKTNAIQVALAALPSDDCVLWTGYVQPDGYGWAKWSEGGVEHRAAAHVAVYERVVGPVPEGHELDHVCRVRSCVNPDPRHLEPVTSQENVHRQRALALGYDPKVTCPSGHPREHDGAPCRRCNRDAQRRRRELVGV